MKLRSYGQASNSGLYLFIAALFTTGLCVPFEAPDYTFSTSENRTTVFNSSDTNAQWPALPYEIDIRIPGSPEYGSLKVTELGVDGGDDAQRDAFINFENLLVIYSEYAQSDITWAFGGLDSSYNNQAASYCFDIDLQAVPTASPPPPPDFYSTLLQVLAGQMRRYGYRSLTGLINADWKGGGGIGQFKLLVSPVDNPSLTPKECTLRAPVMFPVPADGNPRTPYRQLIEISNLGRPFQRQSLVVNLGRTAEVALGRRPLNSPFGGVEVEYTYGDITGRLVIQPTPRSQPLLNREALDAVQAWNFVVHDFWLMYAIEQDFKIWSFHSGQVGVGSLSFRNANSDGSPPLNGTAMSGVRNSTLLGPVQIFG